MMYPAERKLPHHAAAADAWCKCVRAVDHRRGGRRKNRRPRSDRSLRRRVHSRTSSGSRASSVGTDGESMKQRLYNVAALHFLFNHATPPDAMIRQLAIPFVVIECDFAFFQTLLRSFAFAPGFAAVELVEFAFSFCIPRIEQFARVTALRLAVAFALREHLFGQFAGIFLLLLVRHFDLLLGIFHGNRLEE